MEKVNPADNLSLQSLNQAVEQKNLARAKNMELVQRMKIPETASDAQIQQILSETIQKDKLNSSQSPVQSQSVQSGSISVSKMSPRQS